MYSTLAANCKNNFSISLGRLTEFAQQLYGIDHLPSSQYCLHLCTFSICCRYIVSIQIEETLSNYRDLSNTIEQGSTTWFTFSNVNIEMILWYYAYDGSYHFLTRIVFSNFRVKPQWQIVSYAAERSTRITPVFNFLSSDGWRRATWSRV